MNKNILLITIIILFSIARTSAENRINLRSDVRTDTLYQIQDSTIEKVVEIDLDTPTSLTPLVADNQIFAPTDDGLIYCYDLKGNKKWITEVTGNISTNIVRYKDLILTATVQGDLYSINANNGDVVQVMGIGEKVTTDLILIDFLNGNTLSKAVVFGTEKGNVFYYDIFSFELGWKTNVSKVPLVDNILILNDKLILKNNSSTIFCLNSKSGILIWKYDAAVKDNSLSNSQVLSDGKNIFYLSPINEIISIDLMLGKKFWGTKPLDVIQKFYLNYNNQYLILLSKKGEFIFISSKDGKEAGKTLIQNQDITNFNCASGSGFTMMLTSNGSVYQLDDNFSLKELIKFLKPGIKSINLISDKQFIFSTDDGKILLFNLE